MSNKNQAGTGLQFLFGGLAGMAATCVVQPIDLIKTRMQLSGEKGQIRAHKTMFHAFVNIAKQEGPKNLYKGLSAALLRQATYTTARLGSYSWLLETLGRSYNTKFLKASEQNTPAPFGVKLISGMLAGGFGAVIGTPAEVALIRMTSDGRLPIEQRRNYKNVVDALTRICKTEGVLTMWRGCSPTVLRAMVLNACQLSSYTQAKQVLLSGQWMNDGVGCHFVASLISGFLSTVVSIPIDLTKTRIQTMRVVNGVPEYSGVMDVLTKTIKSEGFFSLWKGFTPYFLRLGPHTIITFLVLEQMNSVYNKLNK